MPDEPIYVYRKRRNLELVMVLLAVGISFAAYCSIHLNLDATLPDNWMFVLIVGAVIGIVAHVVVRIRVPYADPLILPAALLLNGLGLAMIHRLDLANPAQTDAPMQLIWTGLGVLLFVVTLIVINDHRALQRFPYILFLVGLVLLLLPMVPGLGVEEFGARIWIRVGPFSFQPGEIAKIVLSLAFAAYLVEKREVLALAGRRFIGIDLPRARDLGPILIMWVASVLVLVYETDLGSSLLFFGLFVVMLYVATERPGWVFLGVIMFAAAAVAAYALFAHVKVRVNAWLNPMDNVDRNWQVIQGMFALDWGGILGRGLGLGSPWMIPLAKSDMIIAALTEELGMAGFMAIIMLFVIISARGLRAALASREPFGKLLAVGLSFGFALQTFIIVGGVTRAIPLTGLTTPFMSRGGTSLIANWIIMAALIVISHQARKPTPPPEPVTADDVEDLADDRTQVISAGRPVHQSTPEAEEATA